jgi:uncharacterized membrane protein HdeD (DUF308 family)
MMMNRALTRQVGRHQDREVHLIQTLMKNWWLLALCGVLDAIISVIYFNHAQHGFHAFRDVVFLGELTLAAGVCTIAAGIWTSRWGESWLLILNGLALGALGLIFSGLFGHRIQFRTIALLLGVIAISIAIAQLLAARSLGSLHHLADEWFFGVAGAASIGFGFVFFAYAFRSIKLEPGTHSDLLWFGCYFAFSAICMLGLALRVRRLDLPKSGPWEALPPLENPKPAH